MIRHPLTNADTRVTPESTARSHHGAMLGRLPAANTLQTIPCRMPMVTIITKDGPPTRRDGSRKRRVGEVEQTPHASFVADPVRAATSLRARCDPVHASPCSPRLPEVGGAAMLEFSAGWLVGQRAQRPLPARASIDLAGVNRYRPLQAWAYVVGRRVGLAFRSISR